MWLHDAAESDRCVDATIDVSEEEGSGSKVDLNITVFQRPSRQKSGAPTFKILPQKSAVHPSHNYSPIIQFSTAYLH